MLDIKNKRLYRSPNQALVLGIAAGLGNYFEVDPVFVRLIILALGAILHVWPVVALYVLLFFIVPIDPSQDTVPQSQTPKDVT